MLKKVSQAVQDFIGGPEGQLRPILAAFETGDFSQLPRFLELHTKRKSDSPSHLPAVCLLVCKFGNVQAMETLLTAYTIDGTELDSKNCNVLHLCSLQQDATLLNRVLASLSPPVLTILMQTRSTGEGFLPFHVAVAAMERKKDADGCFNALLPSAEIDCEDWAKRTPLMIASNNGQLGMVEALLQRGADVIKRDSGLCTALGFAAKNGEIEVMKVLLKRMREVMNAAGQVKSEEKKQTSEDEDSDMEEATPDAMEDVYFFGRDLQGNTVLHQAVFAGWLPSAELLLEAEPRLLLSANRGNQNVAHLCCARNDNSRLQLLSFICTAALEKGLLEPLLTQTAAFGFTPLHEAAQKCNPQAIAILCENAAKCENLLPKILSAADHDGMTPLHSAVRVFSLVCGARGETDDMYDYQTDEKGCMRVERQNTIAQLSQPLKLQRYSILDSSFKELKEEVQAKLQRQKEWGSPQEERSVASILGMAVGDAMGHPFEFQPVRYGVITATGMGEGRQGKFCLLPGQWTDDASMGLCLADSLLVKGRLDPIDAMLRFQNWWHHGYNNAFGYEEDGKHSVGLGGNIHSALGRFKFHGEPFTKAGDAQTSGNGSVMRLAPVAIFFQGSEEKAELHARESSLVTHQGEEAAECCRLLAHVICKALAQPAPSKAFLEELPTSFTTNLDSVRHLANSECEGGNPDRNWNWKANDFRYSPARSTQDPGYIGSYAMDAMAMALHCVYSTNSAREALVKVVNLRGDADSVGSVVGQIVGALYGFHAELGLPLEWVNEVQKWDNHGDIALKGHLLSLGHAIKTGTQPDVVEHVGVQSLYALLKAGAKVTMTDDAECTPLHLLAYQAMAGPVQRGKQDCSCKQLQQVVAQPLIDAVRALLTSADSSFEPMDGFGWTALHPVAVTIGLDRAKEALAGISGGSDSKIDGGSDAKDGSGNSGSDSESSSSSSSSSSSGDESKSALTASADAAVQKSTEEGTTSPCRLRACRDLFAVLVAFAKERQPQWLEHFDPSKIRAKPAQALHGGGAWKRIPVETRNAVLDKHLDLDGIVNHLTKIAATRRPRVVVMCGAGISVGSGIPDFRSAGTGVYSNEETRNIFNLGYLMANPAKFYAFAHKVFGGVRDGTIKPNFSHHFLAILARKRWLQRVYTQNIDMLEGKAGVPTQRVIEAHGTFSRAFCTNPDCRWQVPEESMEALFWDPMRSGGYPVCSKCKATVRPDVVFFGEGLPNSFSEHRKRDFSRCDLLIVMGTTLMVYPFAGLANEVGLLTPRLLLNREAVGPFKQCDNVNNYRDVRVLGDCDKGCLELAEKLGWGEEVKLFNEQHSTPTAAVVVHP